VGSARGTRTENIEPFPGVDVTHIFAPRRSAERRRMARPRWSHCSRLRVTLVT
jgi:hypothetical protein